MNITTIELPIYELDIVTVISDDFSTVNKKFRLSLTEEDFDVHALTLLHPEYRGRHEVYLILKPKYLDYNTVCHELEHIVMYICQAKGISPDPENDEPLAYLQGYIGQKIFEFRDKYVLGVK